MKQEKHLDLNRRDFLRGSSLATMMMMMGGVPLNAAEENPLVNPDGSTTYTGQAKPLPVGVIGCGTWGREIISTLSTITFGPVVAVSDTYPAYLKRGGRLAPEAKQYADYRELLADENVKGVIVATPTHLHKQVVLDALAAGKHVYCEAPIAHTVEDAQAIAAAAHKAVNVNFQPGLQSRSDKQMVNLYNFRIKAGIVGTRLKARGQFHRKMSWRFSSPNPDREKEINWRLDPALSLGIVGELGIHQLDLINWYFGLNPLAVTGLGALVNWKDGREVPDNVQALLQYEDLLFHNYECTICNSFNAEMGVVYGTDSAIMMRDRHAWMFKEADAPLLGWEVYSRKDNFYNESGVVLGAGGTKQDTHTAKGAAILDAADPKSPLQYSLEAFLINSYDHAAGVADFTAMFGGDDLDALRDYLVDSQKSRVAAATLLDGYVATITAIKANEAIVKNGRVEIPENLFKLG
ncbi:MAG: Gfo/Idh/MocA family oxidoreductase [Verrucomicrobiae bacterium]|nr:Gfo/Idh/MocA family oxidoreductase [Verrucomicrobiae bacterium]MCP5524892.1 Gfo/Idh/MocA family oxidoreductase [Verrucomicrobiales bacterium]